MNRDLEEKKIRESFLELKREDEPSAPPFEEFLKRVPLERSSLSGRRISFQAPLRIAAGLLLTAGICLTLYFRHSAKEPLQIEPKAVEIEANSLAPSSAKPIKTEPSEIIDRAPDNRTASNAVKRPRKRRLSESVDARAISRWRPSTDFLLRSTGEELLRSIPRLGEHLTYTEFGPIEEN